MNNICEIIDGEESTNQYFFNIDYKNLDNITINSKNNGIVYGGSAGAIIYGKDLDSCMTDDENEVQLTDISGFDMLNGYSLLCHFTNRDETRTKNSKEYLLELSKQKPIYAIPEEDTIYVDETGIEFIGTRPYYIFEHGAIPLKKSWTDERFQYINADLFLQGYHIP